MKEGGLRQFDRVMGRFRDYMEARGFTPSTLIGYTRDLRVFRRFLEGEDVERIEDVNRETLYRYQMSLHGWRTRLDKPLCLTTQLKRLAVVRSFFHFLVISNVLASDPSAGIELPKVSRPLPREILTRREVESILRQPDVDKVEGLRDRAIMELLYSTGLRNSELRLLKVGAVDVGHGEIHVWNGKGRKDRVVPLGEIAGRYVEEYLRYGRPAFVERRLATLAGMTPERRGAVKWEQDLLFFSVTGRVMLASRVDELVWKAVRQAGIKRRVTPHVFRHTCATHMLRNGAGIRHLQELLGHRNIASTEIYTHVVVKDLKREHHRCHPRERFAA